MCAPMNSNQKGALAETVIAAEAMKLGIGVMRPYGDERYDLIFDLRPKLLRVQCKWAPRRGDVVVLTCAGSWFSPGRGYVRSTYGEDEIDAVAAYCPDLDRCFLLPIELVDGRNMLHLRLEPTRNGQRAALHFAVDYEFRGAVAQLAEHFHGMEGAEGSSPSSSTFAAPTEAQQVEVGAHIFRNRFGYYMERAAAGEEIAVSRRGKPHVRLVPAHSSLLD
jgi:prevent-host-death family protein